MVTRRCPFAASNDAFGRSPIGNDPLKASSLAWLPWSQFALPPYRSASMAMIRVGDGFAHNVSPRTANNESCGGLWLTQSATIHLSSSLAALATICACTLSSDFVDNDPCRWWKSSF